MKKITLIGVVGILALGVAACSLNFRDMGIPFIATSTNTPRPPAKHTPTPTLPPKTGVAGDRLQTEIQEDNTTLLTDAELGYQAVFSAEWFLVIADSPIEEQLAAAFGEQIADETRTFVSKQSQQPGFRVIALDYTQKYSNRPLAYFTLNYLPNPATADSEMLDVLDKTIEVIPTRTPEADVIYQNVEINAHGLEYGKMILNQTDSDTGIQLKKIVALFKVSDGLLTFTGVAWQEDYEKLEIVFQKAINSIQAFE
ncbi:MAG: hypothetical protein P8Y68_01225 [Anaerolineales bacterium]